MPSLWQGRSECSQSRQYSYSVKIFPEKVRDAKLLTWHNVHDVFKTPDELKDKLRESFTEYVPMIDENEKFNIGFFEGRATSAANRKWIVCPDDLSGMYASFGDESEITLWCDGKSSESELSKRKKRVSPPSQMTTLQHPSGPRKKPKSVNWH